jgi:hypothetical protein
MGVVLAVAVRSTEGDLLAQPAQIGVTLAQSTGWQIRGQQPQVERAGPPQVDGRLVDPRIAGQPGGHLRPGAKMRGAGRREPAGNIVQAATGADRREHLGQGSLARPGVVDVVRRHHGDVRLPGQLVQRIVPGVVERLVVIDQLDVDVLTAERVDERIQLCPRGPDPRRATARQRSRDRPLAAAGQDRPVPARRRGGLGQRRPVVARRALAPAQLSRADRR